MENTKNILMVCKSMPWRFNGGIQTHTWELAQALAKQGQSVTILTGGAFRQPERTVLKEGVKIVEVPFFPGRYIKPVALLAEELSFNLTVKGWVRKNHRQFDVIHVQGRSGYMLVLNPNIREKVVTTFHGLIDFETKQSKRSSLNVRLHASVVRLFERLLAYKSKRTIAVSESLIKDIKTNVPWAKEIQMIPNGVKLQHTAQQFQLTNEARFLFVGRLHPVKGLKKLIDEFHLAVPEVKLDIIGDGLIRQELEEQVKAAGLQEQIQFLGAQDNEVILSMMPSYRALVLPSEYETQGIVLLEANAQSVPVIASDLPAIQESVIHGHNGLLCDPSHGRGFVQAMNFLAKDPEYASKMGAKGYLRVQKLFGWENIAKKTLETYNKIAS